MRCTWLGYGNLFLRGNMIPPGGTFDADESDFSVMAPDVRNKIGIDFDDVIRGASDIIDDATVLDLSSLTKAQLVAMADDMGLDLDVRMRKDDIIDAIELASIEE